MFWARLQLLARLTLNTRNNAADQPARLAHLDDGNDRAILVEGDEGPAQVVRLGHRALHQLGVATMVPSPRRLPHTISPAERAGFELLAGGASGIRTAGPPQRRC